MSNPDLSYLRGRKVLVAEDELIIATLITEVPTENGCKVIGPFSAVAPALAAIGKRPVDAAFLDVNLGRERSYPFAKKLEALGIPFSCSLAMTFTKTA